MWCWEELRGRLVELSAPEGGPLLSPAFELVGQAQSQHQPCAWVTHPLASFYPPDAATAGIDLQNLAVVFASEPFPGAQASLRLLAGGGFGLVVLDLVSFSRGCEFLPMKYLSRLTGLARKHHALALVLTQKGAERSSLGSLVSLRVEARSCGGKEVELVVLKDKRGGLGRKRRQCYALPSGLPQSSGF